MDLSHIPQEDKARIFDLLVKTFQGQGKYVGDKLVKAPYDRPDIAYRRIPTYEFVMRVDGHDDFCAGLLALLKDAPND